MKMKRKYLMRILIAFGVFMIGYGIFRYFTGIGFSEGIEKYIFDIMIFGALGIFIYNRKMIKDEKAAREAKEEAERQAAARAAEQSADPSAEPSGKPENENSPEDENLPHWERHE